jgi:ribosome-associated protein
VRDAVKKGGMQVMRTEGEDNGEWIIVDCGAAVAHIMQPAIRQYYHLEEIWGDKPVRLKLGAPKPAAPAAKAEPVASGKAPSLRRSSAAKTAVREAEQAARKPAAKKAAAKKTAAKKTVAKKAVTKVAAGPVKLVVGKPVAKKAPAKKTAARKAPSRGK